MNSYKIYRQLLFTLGIFLTGLSLDAQSEAWYIEKIAEHMNGQTEVSVENGRIDVVTNTRDKPKA